VWWKSSPTPSISSLDPRLPLHAHFPASQFSLPHTPTAQDTSAHTHALALEALLGGPDLMAARLGLCATPALAAAQLLRAREGGSGEVWARTGKVQLASAFLASLIMGRWASTGETEACATGMWTHTGSPGTNGVAQSQAQSGWDETVLEIVGGSREEGRKMRGWLGDADANGGGRKSGAVSRYLVERYGFDPGKRTTCTEFESSHVIFPRRRDDSNAIHIRLPLCLSITLPIPRRCSSELWSD
jgi:xylulokinase